MILKNLLKSTASNLWNLRSWKIYSKYSFESLEPLILKNLLKTTASNLWNLWSAKICSRIQFRIFGSCYSQIPAQQYSFESLEAMILKNLLKSTASNLWNLWTLAPDCLEGNNILVSFHRLVLGLYLWQTETINKEIDEVWFMKTCLHQGK